MIIPKSKMEEIDIILEIYEYARGFMRLNGNPNQWKDSDPSVDLIIEDIESDNSYVIEEGNRIVGVFSFIIGNDSSYQYIENGSWLNGDVYGTIHRIVSDGSPRIAYQKVINRE